MYGMINEAMRRQVVESSSESVWESIARRAASPRTFASLHYYDDEVTYALVASASTELAVPADELLRSFGRYWSTRVGPENYADILGATGTDVVSVLRHLDEMHARLQLLHPELRPPSFVVAEEDDASFTVHYSSERTGLASFVVGLLEGLGELYGTPASVEHLSEPVPAAPYHAFRVSLEK